MRNRLIELLETDIECNKDGHGDCEMCPYSYADRACTQHISELIADMMLSKGVIASPVKVGDYVYTIKGAYCKEPKYCTVSKPLRVNEISIKHKRDGKDTIMRGFITENGTRYSFDNIGKTVFLTKEEAEKELARRRGE